VPEVRVLRATWQERLHQVSVPDGDCVTAFVNYRVPEAYRDRSAEMREVSLDDDDDATIDEHLNFVGLRDKPRKTRGKAHVETD
jgi:hypothetical protein